ncbi:calcium/sodium antiporter [Bremerella sp. JC817]|uniref:calcium/sodium antiporter n=1 Tax=Bremerella sp. JC817 TaxID=3231756 RepID=UPI00345A953B
MLVAAGLILIGLVALVIGGELLVRGASQLASLIGVSPLVIGLTVVAFGTSAPELAVSLKAGFAGNADIAVGNVIGSNIFNVLLILGLSALVAPLAVNSQLIRLELPLMIGVSVLVWVMGLNGNIGRIEGGLLFAGLAAYIVWSVVQSRRESKAIKEEFAEEFAKAPSSTAGTILQLVWIALGLVGLAFGSKWLVDGAVMIARQLGMSELLIGLTIVAAGTSLPEVVASVMASLKGERDIAVGNVVGSNLFNLMCVLGLTSVIMPDGVPVASTAIWQDMPIMIGASLLCLPIFFTARRIDRWEGGIFLGWYVLYTTYLVLKATNPTLAYGFGLVAVWGLIPLTVVVLLVSVVLTRPAEPELPQNEGASG